MKELLCAVVIAAFTISHAEVLSASELSAEVYMRGVIAGLNSQVSQSSRMKMSDVNQIKGPPTARILTKEFPILTQWTGVTYSGCWLRVPSESGGFEMGVYSIKFRESAAANEFSESLVALGRKHFTSRKVLTRFDFDQLDELILLYFSTGEL